jgi:hypothetical protein
MMTGYDAARYKTQGKKENIKKERRDTARSDRQGETRERGSCGVQR